jgi:hypothetical protein
MQHPRFVGAKGSADVAEGPPEVRLSDSISKFCLVLCFFGTVMVAYSGYLVHAVWRGEFPTQMTDMVNCRPDGSVELQASVAWHLSQAFQGKRFSRTCMTRRNKAAIVFVWMIGWVAGLGQSTQGTVADAEMTAASLLVGRALFLRGFYLNNELTYDAAGKVRGEPKVGDWTLAAMNVLTVARRGTGEIELDGVRAAVRYNTDNHEFERHVLKDEKIQVVVADPGDSTRLEAVFAEIFSVGIDPEMQRAMPDYWRHYFNPALAWPEDALDGQTVYPMNGPGEPSKDVD